MRILHANIHQHGVAAVLAAFALNKLNDVVGVNDDATLTEVNANAGDHFALEVGAAVPFMMVDIQKVPGDESSDDWEYFFSLNPDTPVPLNGIVQKNGAYVGLWHPAKPGKPSYNTGERVWFVGRALKAVHNGHVHLVKNG